MLPILTSCSGSATTENSKYTDGCNPWALCRKSDIAFAEMPCGHVVLRQLLTPTPITLSAVIIYDDLSKQAVAYRQMSLLLRRPPGA